MIFLPELLHFKELSICYREPEELFFFIARGVIHDPKLITQKFVNVERLLVRNANDETILTIVKGLPKLKMFALKCYNNDGHTMNTLNLKTLNEE